MKIFVWILIGLLGFVPNIFVTSLGTTKGIITVKEGKSPGGVWKTNTIWKSYWVKDWQTRQIYVPVWKRVWGPVEVRQWIPLIKPHPHPHTGWKPH